MDKRTTESIARLTFGAGCIFFVAVLFVIAGVGGVLKVVGALVEFLIGTLLYKAWLKRAGTLHRRSAEHGTQATKPNRPPTPTAPIRRLEF